MTPTRREFIKRSALTATAAGLGGLAFTAPACPGPSKEKAVRVAGFVISLGKESLPLLELLGGHDIADLMRDKVIPALEKMKEALEDTDIPASESTLQTVRSVLGGVETALLNLPDSARRTTVIGILASVRVLLLTVEAFIDSEMPASVAASRSAARTPGESKALSATIHQVFEVVRQ